MHAETLAPHRHISSQSISLQNASALLEKYLANSQVHPHLHPDALITPSGTTFGAQGGPTGGVVMHNLRRVAAGLKGEYLEPEPTPEPEGEQDQNKTGLDGLDDPRDYWKGKKVAGTADEDWQDKSDFEREEGVIEVGEIDDRSNFVQQSGEAPGLEAVDGAEQDGEGKRRRNDDGEKLDKAARKKAKKAKDKEFRAQKEKARAEKLA